MSVLSDDAVLGDDADHNAELLVCSQVCAIEAEARSWQLRCFQAEAELRLLKQRRRGERHPRWPADNIALGRLRANACQLEAEAVRLEASARQPVRDLTNLKMANGRLQDYICRAADNISLSDQKQADLKKSMESSQAHWKVESQALLAREELLNADTESARYALNIVEALQRELTENREAFEAARAQKEQFSAQKAAAHLHCDRLGMGLEDALPRLQQLAEICRLASGNASRATGASRRKNEAHLQAEQEAHEAVEVAEENELSEQRTLQECREELQETRESSLDVVEQARRARYSHSQQVQAVRKGDMALRAALADSDVEVRQRAEELARLQEALSTVLIGHETRLSREREARSLSEALDDEVEAAASRLFALGESATEAAEKHQAVLVAIASASGDHSRASEEHSEASMLKDRATNEASELRLQLQRMCNAFGAAATERRGAEEAEYQREQEELEEEGIRLRTRCEAMSAGASLQQHGKEQQLIARRAAWEAASKLKASYVEFAKQFREGRSRGPSDNATIAGKAVKRIGRHVNDLVRFLDASAKAASDAETTPGEEIRLPESVIESFVTAHEQGKPGSLNSELVNAERQKVSALRSAMQEANQAHIEEMERVQDQQENIAQQLRLCEAEVEDLKISAQKKRATFEIQLQEAGVRQTQAHMGAVAELQRQLQAHSHELARLGRERAELHTRRCRMICRGAGIKRGSRSPSPASSPPGGLPLQQQVQLKEREVSELRNDVAAARSRYLAFLAEAEQVVQPTAIDVMSPRQAGSPVAMRSVQHSPSMDSRHSGSFHPDSHQATIGSTGRGTPTDASGSLPPTQERSISSSGQARVGSAISEAFSRRRASGSSAGATVYRITEQPAPATDRATSHVAPVSSSCPSTISGPGISGAGEAAALTGVGGMHAMNGTETVTPKTEGAVIRVFSGENRREVKNEVGMSPSSDGGGVATANPSSTNIAAYGGFTNVGRETGHPAYHAEAAVSPDVNIGMGIQTSPPTSVRLQSGTSMGQTEEHREADVRSPPSSALHVISTGPTSESAEYTPSPARSLHSEVRVPGSAVLVKARRHETTSTALTTGTTLEFDEANISGFVAASKPRRVEPGTGAVNNSAAYEYDETTEYELIDRPMLATPRSQVSRTPMMRYQPEMADNGHDAQGESVVAADMADQGDLSDFGGTPSSVPNGTGFGGAGSASSPSRSFATPAMRTTASVASMQPSSHTIPIPQGPPLRPVPTHVATSRSASPSHSPVSSPRITRAPQGGRMAWSAVGHSPTASQRSYSPGMPGPPRRSVSPLHAGPITSWSAIAGEAMSPTSSPMRPSTMSAVAVVGATTSPPSKEWLTLTSKPTGSTAPLNTTSQVVTTQQLPYTAPPRSAASTGSVVSAIPQWPPSELVALSLRPDARRVMPAFSATPSPTVTF